MSADARDGSPAQFDSQDQAGENALERTFHFRRPAIPIGGGSEWVVVFFVTDHQALLRVRGVALHLIREYFVQGLREEMVLQIVGVVDESCQNRMFRSGAARHEQYQGLILHFFAPGYGVISDIDVPSSRRFKSLDLANQARALHIPPRSEV